MAFRMTSRLDAPLRATALCLFAAACTTPPAPAPQPAPVSAAPPPVVASHPADWRDLAVAPGRWRYVAGDPVSSARFGRDGAPADLVLRCDRTTRTVLVLRHGTTHSLTITTSSGANSYPAGAVDEAGQRMSGASFNARDGLFDRIMYSRGRFMVTAPGLAPLAVPAWAEPARAVEDCRK